MNFVTGYCRLTKDVCIVNGETVSRRDADSEDVWLKQIYKTHELVYPKFYKMDLLAQAGFLGSELLKRTNTRIAASYQDDEIALIFANSSSSTDTDVRFLKSYEGNSSPSPSLFVYTLPNIILGEIAIANKWYGENMFAVLPNFAPDFFINYINMTLTDGSQAALCGWLEVLEDEVDVFLFFVEKGQFGQERSLQLSSQNLTDLYNQKPTGN